MGGYPWKWWFIMEDPMKTDDLGAIVGKISSPWSIEVSFTRSWVQPNFFSPSPQLLPSSFHPLLLCWLKWTFPLLFLFPFHAPCHVAHCLRMTTQGSWGHSFCSHHSPGVPFAMGPIGHSGPGRAGRLKHVQHKDYEVLPRMVNLKYKKKQDETHEPECSHESSRHSWHDTLGKTLLGDTLGRHYWETLLAWHSWKDTPGRHSWKDTPDMTLLAWHSWKDPLGKTLLGRHSWEDTLDTLGGLSWETTLGRHSKRAFCTRLPPLFTLCTWKIDVFLYVFSWSICHVKIDVSCEASVSFHHWSKNATPSTEFARFHQLTQPWHWDSHKIVTSPHV